MAKYVISPNIGMRFEVQCAREHFHLISHRVTWYISIIFVPELLCYSLFAINYQVLDFLIERSAAPKFREFTRGDGEDVCMREYVRAMGKELYNPPQNYTICELYCACAQNFIPNIGASRKKTWKRSYFTTVVIARVLFNRKPYMTAHSHDCCSSAVNWLIAALTKQNRLNDNFISRWRI